MNVRFVFQGFRKPIFNRCYFIGIYASSTIRDSTKYAHREHEMITNEKILSAEVSFYNVAGENWINGASIELL